MTVRRLSISLPVEVEQHIRNAAAQAGVSVSEWIAEATEHTVRVNAGLAAIAEYEAENGPIPSEALQRGRDLLNASQLGETQRLAS